MDVDHAETLRILHMIYVMIVSFGGIHSYEVLERRPRRVKWYDLLACIVYGVSCYWLVLLGHEPFSAAMFFLFFLVGVLLMQVCDTIVTQARSLLE